MDVYEFAPGPLTFRIMLRVWSSMNSTRTWVTPPREPVAVSFDSKFRVCCRVFRIANVQQGNRTGSAQDTGDLDKLDGLLRSFHIGDLSVLIKIRAF